MSPEMMGKEETKMKQILSYLLHKKYIIQANFPLHELLKTYIQLYMILEISMGIK